MRPRTTLRPVLLGFFGLLLLGCGSSGGSNKDAGNACVPGQQVSCACPGSNVTGVQVCNLAGSAFGACMGCPGSGGAGANGAAGAAGGGSAGTAGAAGGAAGAAGGAAGAAGGTAGAAGAGAGGAGGAAGHGAAGAAGGAAGAGAGGCSPDDTLTATYPCTSNSDCCNHDCYGGFCCAVADQEPDVNLCGL